MWKNNHQFVMSKNSNIDQLKQVKKVSKRHATNLAMVQELTKGKPVEVSEAIEILLKTCNTKEADTSFELHAKLGIDPTKSDQFVRGAVVLPNGTGKKIRVAAFVTPNKETEAREAGADLVGGEELINEIKTSGKIEFDSAVAEPDMMKKLPIIAKQLGIAGVMPSPKTGTIGENIGEIVKLIKAGKVDYKNDKTGNIHIMFGKQSFGAAKLEENLKTLIDNLEKAKPESFKKTFIKAIYLTTTMGPSVKIALR
jgi:large subunit ribosomal protein L1